MSKYYIIARNIHNNEYDLISVDDSTIEDIDYYTSRFKDKYELIEDINDRGYSIELDSDIFIAHNNKRKDVLFDDVLYKNLNNNFLLENDNQYPLIYKRLFEQYKKDSDFQEIIRNSEFYIPKTFSMLMVSGVSNPESIKDARLSAVLKSYSIMRKPLILLNEYNSLDKNEIEYYVNKKKELFHSRENMKKALSVSIDNPSSMELFGLKDHFININTYFSAFKELQNKYNIRLNLYNDYFDDDSPLIVHGDVNKLKSITIDKDEFDMLKNFVTTNRNKEEQRKINNYILNVITNDNYFPNDSIEKKDNKYYINFDKFDYKYSNEEKNILSAMLDQKLLSNIKEYKDNSNTFNNYLNSSYDKIYLEKEKLDSKHSIEAYLESMSNNSDNYINELYDACKFQKSTIDKSLLNDKIIKFLLTSDDVNVDEISNNYKISIDSSNYLDSNMNNYINLLSQNDLNNIAQYKQRYGINKQEHFNFVSPELKELEKIITKSIKKSIYSYDNQIDYEALKKDYYALKEKSSINSSADSIGLNDNLRDSLVNSDMSQIITDSSPSSDSVFVKYTLDNVEIKFPDGHKETKLYNDKLLEEMDSFFKKYSDDFLIYMAVDNQVLSSELDFFSGSFPSNYHKYDAIVFEDNPSSKIITIPDSFATRFFANKVIKVEIPDSIEEIGNNSFEDCIQLAYIKLPEDTLKVGKAAFKGCKTLKNADFLGLIDEIPDDLFNGCETLEEFDIPASVQKIGDRSFFGCKKISEIDLKECVEIGDLAFSNTSIEHLHIPGTVKKIGKGFLANCSLEFLAMPEIQDINKDVFLDCEVQNFLYGNILSCTAEEVTINTSFPIKEEFLKTFGKFINGKDKYIINGIEVNSSLFDKDGDITLKDVLQNFVYTDNAKYEKVIKDAIKKMDDHLFGDVVDKKFNFYNMMDNIESLFVDFGFDEEAVSNILANSYNLFCYSFDDAFKNFERLLNENIVSKSQLTLLYFDEDFDADTPEKVKSFLKNYYTRKNIFPKVFNSLIIEHNNSKNEVELRSRLVSVSNMNISLEEKKQILTRDNFDSIVAYDKNYFNSYNVPLNISNKYEYFDGVYSSIFKKLDGYDKNIFKTIFLDNFNEQGYPNTILQNFISSMNVVKEWDSYDDKVKRATLFKNEFCAKVLYSCIYSINESFTTRGLRITNNDLATDMLNKMERYNISLDCSQILTNNVDFSDDKIIKIMLSIDPYAIEAFKTKEGYSDNYIKYIKIAEEKGYFMSEKEKKEFNDYLDINKSTIPNYEEYKINSTIGIDNTADSQRVYRFINNDISVPLVSDRNKGDYLNNLKNKVNIFINNNFIDNDQINLNKILSLVDVYFRSNNCYIDFEANDKKKSKLYDTIAKMYRNESDFTDYDKIAFTMVALNKMAHSVTDLELPVNFIDKYKLSKRKNQYRSETENFIRNCNDFLKYDFDFETIDYLVNNEIKFDVDTLSDDKIKSFLSMLQKKGSTVNINDVDVPILKKKIKKIGEFRQDHNDIYDDIKILAEENHVFFDIKRVFAEQLMDMLKNEVSKKITSMTLDEKKDFFKNNGCLGEIQADGAGDPVLVFFSKRFNEAFSIHLKGFNADIDANPIICHSKLNDDYRLIFPTVRDSYEYKVNNNANLNGFLSSDDISTELGIAVDSSNIHEICRDINMTRLSSATGKTK